MASEYRLSFVVRAGDVEVGIRGGDLVVRRTGPLAQLLRELGIFGLLQLLYGRQDRIPLALASVHYTGGVLRIYRSGQPWMVIDRVEDHYVAMDLAEEIRRFR